MSREMLDDESKVGRPGGARPPKRWSAARKASLALRLLRGENAVELVRETGVAPEKLAEWRHRFREAGEEGLKSRGHPDRELVRARAELNDVTMRMELASALVKERDVRAEVDRVREAREWVSPATGRRYPLRMICDVWRVARSTVYTRENRESVSAPREPRKRGPKTEHGDEELLGAIRSVRSGRGEGHRKVVARLRARGMRVSKRRVLRMMRAHGLLAPRTGGRPEADEGRGGESGTGSPDESWSTDATRFHTRSEGWCWFFAVVDRSTGRVMGWHVTKRGDRWAALEPIRQGVRAHKGSYEPEVALGLGLRPGEGPQYRAREFQAELRWLGIRSTPTQLRETEGDGPLERFLRRLKGGCLHLHDFESVKDAGKEIAAFIEGYNLFLRKEEETDSGSRPPSPGRPGDVATPLFPEERDSYANLVVAFPTFRDASTIRRLVERADEVVYRSLPRWNVTLLNCDSHSQDGTQREFLEAATRLDKKAIYLRSGDLGKGHNLQRIFDFALSSAADILICLDGGLREIGEDWFESFVHAVVDEGGDLVMPLYPRFWYDARRTNQVCVPLITGRTGAMIRQPIGGDFAYSRAAIRFLLDLDWPRHALRFGADAFCTLQVLKHPTLRVVQAPLSIGKIHSRRSGTAEESDEGMGRSQSFEDTVRSVIEGLVSWPDPLPSALGAFPPGPRLGRIPRPYHPSAVAGSGKAGREPAGKGVFFDEMLARTTEGRDGKSLDDEGWARVLAHIYRVASSRELTRRDYRDFRALFHMRMAQLPTGPERGGVDGMVRDLADRVRHHLAAQGE